VSARRWEWYFGDLNHRCAHNCGESLVQGRGSLIKYQGQIYHAHCLIDKLTEASYDTSVHTFNPYGHTP
jgi:hypothetical protein